MEFKTKKKKNSKLVIRFAVILTKMVLFYFGEKIHLNIKNQNHANFKLLLPAQFTLTVFFRVQKCEEKKKHQTTRDANHNNWKFLRRSVKMVE